MTNQTADRPFADEPTEVLRAALGLASRHAEQAARFRPAQPGDALPAVVDLLRAELQHREGTLLPPPEGPEYTPCSGCTHIEPEHRPDAGPCLVCDCRAYAPVAVSAAVAPPTDQAAAPAVWVDGHPQLEAIAAAVWEQCRTEGTSLVVDDPRNIAVAALAVLRRMADETATETPTVRTCPPDCPCHAVCIGPAAGARQDETAALNLLPLLASPEPCHWDGPVCTAHLWRSDIGRCPHAQAQALLGGEPR